MPVMIGDRATILENAQKRPVAMIVQANHDGASFDRTSSYANWTRSYRANELVTAISRRNAIQQLVDIRPTVVDESKRIAELEVTAENGRRFTLKGLPVRWSLNVPDNLFVYEKTQDGDGVDRYLIQRLDRGLRLDGKLGLDRGFGQRLGTRAVPTTPGGYARLASWTLG